MKSTTLSALLMAMMFNHAPAQSVWTVRASGTTNALNSLIWNGTQLVAVGAGSTILTSSNGIAWTTRISGTDRSLSSVTWTGSRFVAVGNDSVRTSPDGIVWTGKNGTPVLTSVAWTGNLLVGAWPGGEFLTSSDGVTWTSRTFSYQATPNYVTRIGNQLWGFGRSYTIDPPATPITYPIFTSSDGVAWTYKSVSSTVLASMTGTGNLFAAAGDSGIIQTSPDGSNWTSRISGTRKNLHAVIWINSGVGQFVVVGDSGAILASPDGVSWTAKTSGTKKNLRSVVWTGSQAVAAGDSGIVLTSSDIAAVSPHLNSRNFSMRQTAYQLFATLPVSFLNSDIRAAIYTVTGNKVVEAHSNGSAREISLPLDDLSRGVYLLELQGQGPTIEQPFSLAR